MNFTLIFFEYLSVAISIYFYFRVIDELQPKSLLDAIQNILLVAGSLVVAAVVNPYFLLPALVMTILFMIIRNMYLKITRKLTRLEGIGIHIK